MDPPRSSIWGCCLCSKRFFKRRWTCYSLWGAGHSRDGRPVGPSNRWYGVLSRSASHGWWLIMNLNPVAMYSLKREEYEQLPLHTAQVVGQPDQYLVRIEMFHQLHCLVSLCPYMKSHKIPGWYAGISLELSQEACIQYLKSTWVSGF